MHQTDSSKSMQQGDWRSAHAASSRWYPSDRQEGGFGTNNARSFYHCNKGGASSCKRGTLKRCVSLVMVGNIQSLCNNGAVWMAVQRGCWAYTYWLTLDRQLHLIVSVFERLLVVWFHFLESYWVPVVWSNLKGMLLQETMGNFNLPSNHLILV